MTTKTENELVACEYNSTGNRLSWFLAPRDVSHPRETFLVEKRGETAVLFLVPWCFRLGQTWTVYREL